MLAHRFLLRLTEYLVIFCQLRDSAAALRPPSGQDTKDHPVVREAKPAWIGFHRLRAGRPAEAIRS
jgi:hypothetical protein